VDQLLREGQDWIYRDQTQLATDFENWNQQGIDDIANWFANTTSPAGAFQGNTNAPVMSNEMSGGPVGGSTVNGYTNGNGNPNPNPNPSLNGFGAGGFNGMGMPGFTYDEQSWYQ
jgi:hypothetical protein